jgi:hypothetical protein
VVSPRSSTRLRLVAVLAVLVPLGLGTKIYPGPGSAWVFGHAGGFVYVVFWTLLVLAVRPELSETRVAAWVLVVTCALELLQLWHPPFLEAARRTFLGQALLGSTFSWSDFPFYVAGAVVAVLVARGLAGRVDRPGPQA